LSTRQVNAGDNTSTRFRTNETASGVFEIASKINNVLALTLNASYRLSFSLAQLITSARTVQTVLPRFIPAERFTTLDAKPLLTIYFIETIDNKFSTRVFMVYNAPSHKFFNLRIIGEHYLVHPVQDDFQHVIYVLTLKSLDIENSANAKSPNGVGLARSELNPSDDSKRRLVIAR